MSERHNITAPRDWWTAFADEANRDGQTLSEWLRECGHANLDADVRRRLSTPRPVGKPRKGQ